MTASIFGSSISSMIIINAINMMAIGSKNAYVAFEIVVGVVYRGRGIKLA